MRPALGARTGTGTWLAQRGTAVLLALAVPVLVVGWLAAAPAGYAEWRAFFAASPTRFATLGAGVALALHAWIGLRDIFMDYVRSLFARLALNLLVIVGLAASVAWLATVLWGLA